jgi:hypothetical protein
LSSVETLSPEANASPSLIKQKLFRFVVEARDFLLKAGLKSDFASVESEQGPGQGVAKSNRAYAVSSDT